MIGAVIVAAGEGKRAWPYCGIRQKTTLPILNVPMVRRMTLDLIALGMDEIVVVTGHRGEAVRACLGDVEQVRFVEQRALKGPVDAALLGLAASESDEVLLCCGDVVTTRGNMQHFLNTVRQNRAQAALMYAEADDYLTASYTAVDSTPDGLLDSVWGRGEDGSPRFAGICFGRTEYLKRYLYLNPGIMANTGVGSMPPVEGDIALSFDGMKQAGIEVHTVAAIDFIVDVDKPWHIVEANKKALAHHFDSMTGTFIGEGASIDDGADIAADAKLWLGPGARIGKGCFIRGSAVIGAGTSVSTGAILENRVFIGNNTRCEHYGHVNKNTILGDRNIVSHCAQFEGVAFDVVYLYHYCSLSALIGTHVDIGAATVCGTWRFDNGSKVQQVAGRKETPECYGSLTYLGDYVRTGVNVMFMPGVKIGYYSCVGAGAIVYEDVAERSLLLPKQEQVVKPWGPEKYGW